jgi:hypothetical protein
MNCERLSMNSVLIILAIVQISQEIRGSIRNTIRVKVIIVWREFCHISPSSPVQQKWQRAAVPEIAILHISCASQVRSPYPLENIFQAQMQGNIQISIQCLILGLEFRYEFELKIWSRISDSQSRKGFAAAQFLSAIRMKSV